MRIKIDNRPGSPDEVFGAIRLYPESNEDITKLEWLFSVFKQKDKNNINEEYSKAEVIRCMCGDFHHAIIYKK